MLKKSYVILTI